MNASTTEPSVRELDPFGFFHGHASRIKPLGGPDRGPDPKYGFHTPYFEYRPGPVVFDIRFQDLKVSFGELGLHVNAFIPDSGNHAVLVASGREDMPTVMQDGTGITLRINAVRGVTYAVFGFFAEGTDARAAGMTITAQELGQLENSSVPADAYEPTRFGSESIAQVSALVDGAAPNFRHPISQPRTPRQLDEDCFRNRLHSLSAKRKPEDAWSEAFILQALDRYGVLRLGARGLMLGGPRRSAEDIARCGCPVTIGVDGSDPDDAVPGAANIDLRPMNFEELPDDLRGFDFLWSINTTNRMAGVDRARWFIESAMRSLKPGGIAVHIIDLWPSAEGPPLLGTDHLPLRRSDVTRLGVSLISHNHEIAQLNFGAEAPEDQFLASEIEVKTPDGTRSIEIVPFGLIARA